MAYNARTSYTTTASYALVATSRFSRGSCWTIIVDSDTAAGVVAISEDGTTDSIRLTPGRTGFVSEFKAHKVYAKAISGTPAIQVIDEGPAPVEG